MAEASPLLTVTPKQLGKHLRDVRRKKGLSLSEVARGAGLSRRELVAYERGKVPIPESDLWVLAGSCGVDVAELMPRTSAPELAAGASSTTIGDTVTQLRRNQDDAELAPYLASLHRLKELPPGKRVPVKDRELQAIADALGREPKAMEQRLQKVMHVSPDEASRLRELILPPIRPRHTPKALEAPAAEIPVPAMPIAPPTFLDAPLDTPIDTSVAHNVDVFEELARLPEPLPLGDPNAAVPDMLAPPPPPEGTVELVDGLPQPINAIGFGAGAFAPPEPVLVDAAAAVWNAADAPPIDVAQRQGSDTWDLSVAPAAPLPTRPTDPGSWESTPWQPPAPPGSGSDGPPSFWEGTDDWTPIAPESSLVAPETDEWVAPEPWATPETWTTTDAAGSDAPVSDAWTPTDWEAAKWGDPWTSAPSDPEVVAVDPDDPWTAKEWPQALVADDAVVDGAVDDVVDGAVDDVVDGTIAGAVAAGPWDHQPDPAAVSSGFYVDWGTPEPEATPETAPAPWETLMGSDPGDVGAPPLDDEPIESLEATETTETIDTIEPVEPIEPVEDDSLPMIMWRADAVTPALDAGPAPALEFDVEPAFEPEAGLETEHAFDVHQDLTFEPTFEPAFETAPAFEPAPDPEPAVTEFVTAGNDWQLGNALPLVEVRGQGALVMRRADERWALADVTTAPDFIAEVDLDFRSGPGLGVLFRASVDDAGRMSGYSFDIDPIYDGGGYLVRQWLADRELWNPIARVSSGDPTSMYGSLTVRLVLVDDHLTALVNGVEVLTVESLKQASVDRGREAATGDRVGVQAWSSSDLVIDTLRVAQH